MINVMILVPYPVGWCMSDFVKFGGDDESSTWEHISEYIAQYLGACLCC